MPTAVRGEPVRPQLTASPDELLATLLERTASPPDHLLPLIRIACADADTSASSHALPAEPTLMAGVLSWLHPLLESLSEPWTAEAFRQRCAATAIAAEHLAKQSGRVGTAHHPASGAFVCGLLLKVGQLALYAVFPKGYSRAISRAARSPGGILAGEREIFGLDHLQAGKRLAEAWRLPALVRDSISGARESGADAPARRAVLSAVRHADQLVRSEGIGWPDFVPATEESRCEASFSSDLRAAADELIAIASAAPHHARSHELNSKRDDARWREALRELLDAADDGDLQRACASVARGVRSAFQVPVAVAFAAEARGRMQPAVILTTEERRTRLVLPPELLTAIARGEVLSRAPTELLAANPALASTFAGRLSETLLLRLHHDGRLVGGVLTPTPAAPTECAAGELSLLAAACARVLRAAQAAESQRRFAEAPDASLRQRGLAPSHQAPSLEPLAALAAGAAHELNTPLAVIAGRAQMLQQQVHDPRIRRELAAINEHAQRASDIVSELLACAKPQAPRPESFRLGDWVDRLRQHWQATMAPGSVQIAARISDDNVYVHADPAQLSEAAHAFITNAVEASPPGEARVTINSISRATDETIVVSIGDSGRGMSAETLAQACAPFFSARPAGRGRGLGLSRAARLIEINGGRMWIDSTLGKGTTVHLALPARTN